MSIPVMAEVWASDVKKGRFTLLALADMANEAGICWPGTALLAGNIQKSRATVFRDLADLEADGLIMRRERTRRNGSRTSSVYVINRELLRKRARPKTKDEKAEREEMLQMLMEETESAGE